MGTRKRAEKPQNIDAIVKSAGKLTKAKRLQVVSRLLPPSIRAELADRWFSKDTREDLGLGIEAVIYNQDPSLVQPGTKVGLQTVQIGWEPGISDGPTSSRIAVVDYDADTDALAQPAKWSPERWCFVGPNEEALDRSNTGCRQFHQVNAWAVVRRVLDIFQSDLALGRQVPWGFDGSRLIIVPHAGYQGNAYYDRHSKSLQFYYCGTAEDPVYPCLSHDVIAHETGHAVLDGIRPFFNESSSLQTAAFHEFVADLTAILAAMRNNDLRHALEAATEGDLTEENFIAHLAEEFGRQVENRAYLRSGTEKTTMADVRDRKSPYDWSQVMTGAMFDIMTELTGNYMEKRDKTPREALNYMIDRFLRVALQALDFCPPVDIQFEDYVDAVIRRDQLTNPSDPHKYREIMRRVFKNRGLSPPENEDEKTYADLYCHNIDDVASSAAHAYRFIDRHRDRLGIPRQQDIQVIAPYSSKKVRRARRKLPREIVLQYIWREDVPLSGAEFGELNGQTTTLLCGGTLVYDDRGNLLYRRSKPGTQAVPGASRDRAVSLREAGRSRKEKLLGFLGDCVKNGVVGLSESDETHPQSQRQPMVARQVAGTLRFESIPHLRHWPELQGEES